MKALICYATKEDEILYRKYHEYYKEQEKQINQKNQKNPAGELELTITSKGLTPENAGIVKGYDAVVVQTRCHVDRTLAELLRRHGVKYVLTRSAGYDHFDLQAMKEQQLKAANVAVYSPNAISEHVCMMALMMVRNMKRQLHMIEEGDYSLANIRGRELRNMTIGIVGAGRIGFETIKLLRAFSPRLLVYDVYEREEVKEYGSYVPLDILYKNSDMIIYHCPQTTEDYHMVNEAAIRQMKDGVMLINPARGGLWDYQAVYDGLQSGKIAAAAFDVYETESAYLRKRIPSSLLKDELFKKLTAHERVIYTAHTAFYTDTAIENMVEGTIHNLAEYQANGVCSNELLAQP